MRSSSSNCLRKSSATVATATWSQEEIAFLSELLLESKPRVDNEWSSATANLNLHANASTNASHSQGKALTLGPGIGPAASACGTSVCLDLMEKRVTMEPLNRITRRRKKCHVSVSKSQPRDVTSDCKSSLPASKARQLRYKQLSSSQCLRRIQKSFQIVSSLKRQIRVETENELATSVMAVRCHPLEFNGWLARESQSNDWFLLEKRFSHQRAQQLMHRTWKLWSDTTSAGGSSSGFGFGVSGGVATRALEVDVLQRFNGDGIVLCQDEEDLSAPCKRQRSVFMLFRIETQHGFTICAHSLDVFPVSTVTGGYDANGMPITIEWVNVLHWITFTESEHSDELQVEFGGLKKHPQQDCRQLFDFIERWQYQVVS